MKAVRPYLRPFLVILGILAAAYFLLRRPAEKVTISVTPSVQTGLPTPEATERTLEIVTLLPRDAIPAIDNPRFYSAAEADEEYDPDELVLGISLGGESRAYSTALLSSHEIVNGTVGGRKIAPSRGDRCASRESCIPARSAAKNSPSASPAN